MDDVTRRTMEALGVTERRFGDGRGDKDFITAFNMDEIQSLITAVNESNLSDEWRNLLRAKLDMCQNSLVYMTERIDVKVGF